jgi:hypothetical protein
MSSLVFTQPGSCGEGVVAIQPKAGSVVGSPFSVTTTSQTTPAFKAGAVLVVLSAPCHIHFTKGTTAATTNDALFPAGVYTFAVEDGDKLSIRTASSTATAWIEQARQVGETIT